MPLHEIVINVAMAIALAYAHALVIRYWRWGHRMRAAVTGALYSVVGIMAMMIPSYFAEGVKVDGRGMVLGILGVFEGPVPALFAATSCAAYRLTLGSAGQWLGIASCYLAAGTGLAVHALRRRQPGVVRPLPLLAYGFILHLLLLVLALLVPGVDAWAFTRTIGLWIITLFPVCMVIIGGILVENERSASALRALESSRSRYRSMFDHAHAVMLVIDAETLRILDANPAAEEFYGYSHAELCSMRSPELSTADGALIHTTLNSSLRAWKGSIQAVHRRKDGTLRDVEIFHGALEWDGRPSALTIIHDITERRLLEERTHHALAEARSANELKNVFIANISHEIRTPLNIIMGYTGMFDDLLAESADPAVRSAVQSIHNSGLRLMRTVGMLLDISSFTAGTFRAEIRPHDLPRLLRHVVTEFEVAASMKGITISFTQQDDLPPVDCDAYAMQQAVGNLIDNAIKFTDDGGITVSLHAEDGDAVTRIEDTGIGISQEFFPRIFEAFSQERTGYTRPYEGVGLGLSLVKRYVEIMGGAIAVSSAPMCGTTFTIRLPIRSAANEDA